MSPQQRRFVVIASLCSGLSGRFVKSQSIAIQDQAPLHVYKATDGVSAPSLISPNFTLNAPANCQYPVSGTVTLAGVVDPSGQPQDIQFVRPLSNDLDRLAVKIFAADRFRPAMHEGVAAATGVSVNIALQACVVTAGDSHGKDTHELRLHAQPMQAVSSYDQFPEEMIGAAPEKVITAHPPGIYRVAGEVSAPVPLIPPQPILIGDDQGKAKFQGVVLISLVVDSNGLPQNPRVIRPLGLGLDQKALDAVANYRFKPAMRRRMQPVPVMITTEVNFRIYCDIRANGCLK